MSFVLSFYTDKAYKEYYLPDVNNCDFDVVLTKNIFNLNSDAILKLDIINGRWSIYSTEQYKLLLENDEYDKIDIIDNSKFDICLSEGNVIPVTVLQLDLGLEASKKYFLTSSTVSVGYYEYHDIVNFSSSLMSRDHMKFMNTADGWIVKDESKNGVYVNSKRIYGQQLLKYGDYICTFGLKIVFLGNIITVNENGKNIYVNDKTKAIKLVSDENFNNKSFNKTRSEKEYYNRAPRVFGEISNEEIVIESPPRPKQQTRRSFISTIGPSFTMAIPMILGCLLMMMANRSNGTSSGVFMYTGIVTASASALMGIFWGSVNYRNAKKSEKKEEEERFNKYRDYIMKMAESIKEKYFSNKETLLDKYESAECCAAYTASGSNLWNRNFNHEDVLFHRLGLGEMPFQVSIDIKNEEFSMIDDDLSDLPKHIYDKYCVLKEVPIGIDLMQDRLIGIVGGDNRLGAIELMKSLSVQIAANNCYTDVKLAYILNDRSDSSRRLSFFRFLPHTWSADKKTRFFACSRLDISDVCYELTKIFRMRDESNDTYHSNHDILRPHYIIFIEDISALEGEPLLKYIFSNNNLGVTAIIFSERYEDLPNDCEKIIFNDGNYSGIYTPQTMSNMTDNIVFDEITDELAEKFTRNISCVEVSEIKTNGEIPTSLTFLEMYNAEFLKDLNVIERWRKNRTYETMKAIVGWKSGDLPCYLDLHEKYHGPHGLVAGTTGSGKSELLQTFILSLAINFSPDDVVFLIIDFKGGGMANLFSRLPHLAGKVSNLSGNQVRRAMISIKSENIRRQKIFSDYGVNSINQYTRLLKSKDATQPMPHLFIIIDEFAELKREQPEFLNELISVAQVGRSLGIHLILATQKPAGTVDDNIRSNSKFKLCLRVQDKQDSIDMINKPDAAYISNAGRCYLQVGNDEIFELFQSGWSGATYDEDSSCGKNTVSLITSTGHIALVGKKERIKYKENHKKIWLDSVIQCIKTAFDSYDIVPPFSDYNSNTEMAVVLKTFEIMEQVSLEYPQTEKNVSCIKQLVKIISEIGSIDLLKIINIAERRGIALPEPKEIIQLEAIIKYLENEANKYGYSKPAAIWTPVLPEQLFLEQENAWKAETGWKNPDCSMWSLQVPIGICDDPMNQSQYPVIVDLAKNGNFAVCGGINSGKSTCLQTYVWGLINAYSPQVINLYLLDFSSNMLQVFKDAPHVGGVMNENDDEAISKFFYMIIQILNQRKKVFRGGNYTQFIKNNGYVYPSIIIVIDNYANFRDKTEDKYFDILLEISREGISCGMFLVMSSGGFGVSEIQSKLADSMKTVVALNMGEKQKYFDVLRVNRLEVIPEDVQGRGLTTIDGSILEFQTFLCVDELNDYDRGEKIEKAVKGMNVNYVGKIARKVPEIPEKPYWSDIIQNEEFEHLIKNPSLLPFAYDKKTASLSSVDLSETFCYLICGKKRTGRTNALKVLALASKKKDAQICVIDNNNCSLKKFSSDICADYITTEKELYEYLLSFKETVKERNKIKRALEENGADDMEIFERMSKEKMIAFFISDFSHFLDLVYNHSPNIGNISAFVENILEKGSLHNIYFFFDLNADEASVLSGKKAYALAASYKCGIYLGGKISTQRLFDFSSLPMSYSEQNKTQKLGTGVTTATNMMPCAQVVIPFSKGETK